jgi:hypothetical protein
VRTVTDAVFAQPARNPSNVWLLARPGIAPEQIGAPVVVRGDRVVVLTDHGDRALRSVTIDGGGNDGVAARVGCSTACGGQDSHTRENAAGRVSRNQVEVDRIRDHVAGRWASFVPSARSHLPCVRTVLGLGNSRDP